MKHKFPPLQSSSQGYDVIARMVQYVQDELPYSMREKMTNAIQNCKECREIYTEVVEFLDETPDPQFSVKHKALMQSNRRYLNKLVISTLKKSRTSTLSLTGANDENRLENYHDIDELHCCGA